MIDERVDSDSLASDVLKTAEEIKNYKISSKVKYNRINFFSSVI